MAEGRYTSSAKSGGRRWGGILTCPIPPEAPATTVGWLECVWICIYIPRDGIPALIPMVERGDG